MNVRSSLLLLLVLAGCAQHDSDDVIYGTVERHRLELTAEAHEPIVELLVSEGTHVKAGTVLARLDRADVHARLRQAQSEVMQARERLNELARGSRQQEIVEARAALDAANAELETREREYTRLRQLVTDRLVSESALDAAKVALDAAQSGQRSASARLSLRLEGSRVEAVAQANAALEAAIAREDELKLSAARHDVIAPVAGLVEALPYRKGERPTAGAPVVVMLADEPAFARVYVPASRRVDAQAGATARIEADGIPAIRGQVRYISAEAAFTPYYALTQRERSRLSYLAEITLDGDADVPVGLPVQVTLGSGSERE